MCAPYMIFTGLAAPHAVDIPSDGARVDRDRQQPRGHDGGAGGGQERDGGGPLLRSGPLLSPQHERELRRPGGVH